jgi:hypothetical protein
MGLSRRMFSPGQASAGDRFFEGLLAAHRETADPAGSDWKSAVQEEMQADRGLMIAPMVELGWVSRSGFYHFQDAEPGHGTTRRDSEDCRGVAQLTVVLGSPRNFAGAAGW